MEWFQCWVKHNDPSVDQVSLMQRADPILQRFGSLPCAPPPDGIPVVEADGTIEVRSFNTVGFDMTKRYLEDQGFEIVKEQTND